MGFFDRLLGREVVKNQEGEEVGTFAKRGWESLREGKWSETTKAYLHAVGTALGVDGMQVVSGDHSHDLRGTVAGFPLRVQVTNTGSMNDITFRYEELEDAPYIDLEYDPERQEPDSTVEPWEESEKVVLLGAQVFVEGSDADEAAAAFKKLPRDLQERVISAMRRLRIRYFRSRRDEFDITMHDDANEAGDPVSWLVETLQLAVEVSKARGAVAPGTAPKKPEVRETPSSDDARPAVEALAAAIAKQVLGGKIVVREEDDIIDVRWTESGVPVRIAIDYDFDQLDIEARAEGVRGTFSLQYDADVAREASPAAPADPWDDREQREFFGDHVFVSGTRTAVKAQAELLRQLSPSLLDDIIKLVERQEAQLDFADEVLDLCYDEATSITDKGAGAIAAARLLTRAAAMLSR